MSRYFQQQTNRLPTHRQGTLLSIRQTANLSDFCGTHSNRIKNRTLSSHGFEYVFYFARVFKRIFKNDGQLKRYVPFRNGNDYKTNAVRNRSKRVKQCNSSLIYNLFDSCVDLLQ